MACAFVKNFYFAVLTLHSGLVHFRTTVTLTLTLTYPNPNPTYSHVMRKWTSPITFSAAWQLLIEYLYSTVNPIVAEQIYTSYMIPELRH